MGGGIEVEARRAKAANSRCGARVGRGADAAPISPSVRKSGPLRLLVVDDNRHQRQLLRRTIATRGNGGSDGAALGRTTRSRCCERTGRQALRRDAGRLAHAGHDGLALMQGIRAELPHGRSSALWH
jgi:hypothetical protein